MRAIDTNVALRLIVQDDEEQAGLAMIAIEQPTFLPITVIMECEWVLRSRYGASRDHIARSLLTLLAIPTVHAEDEAGLRWAIERFAEGADLPDVLHVVASAGADCLLTFDRKFAKDARGGPLPVELLDG